MKAAPEKSVCVSQDEGRASKVAVEQAMKNLRGAYEQREIDALSHEIFSHLPKMAKLDLELSVNAVAQTLYLAKEGSAVQKRGITLLEEILPTYLAVPTEGHRDGLPARLTLVASFAQHYACGVSSRRALAEGADYGLRLVAQTNAMEARDRAWHLSAFSDLSPEGTAVGKRRVAELDGLIKEARTTAYLKPLAWRPTWLSRLTGGAHLRS